MLIVLILYVIKSLLKKQNKKERPNSGKNKFDLVILKALFIVTQNGTIPKCMLNKMIVHCVTNFAAMNRIDFYLYLTA